MPTKVQRHYGVDLQSDRGPGLAQGKISSPASASLTATHGACLTDHGGQSYTPPGRPRRGHHTGFPFRDSIVSSISQATLSTRATASTMLLRDASNSMDVLRQRYADSKHSSSTTTSSTPLTDLDLSNHESWYNGTPTAGMTTFLPTLHSTPPMPTFQKPGMHPRGSPASTPTSNIFRRPVKSNNNDEYDDDIAFDPLHSHPIMSTSKSDSADGQATDPQPPVFARRRNDYESGHKSPKRIYIPHRSPETPDGYELAGSSGDSLSHVFYSRGSKAYTTTPLIDRVPDSPSLPAAWNPTLDRLICQADALGLDHQKIVSKVRQRYPQLTGVLTASAIDRRLRQLDQDIEIDYWQVGLRAKDASEARKRERARDLEDQGATRQGDPVNTAYEEQTEQSHSHALQQRQGEQRHQNWSSQYRSAPRGGDDAETSNLKGVGDEMNSRGSRSRSSEAAGPRPRAVTQDFLGGFRSHVG